LVEAAAKGFVAGIIKQLIQQQISGSSMAATKLTLAVAMM